MDDFVVPLAPTWFRVNILSCAPDNTLVYGTKTDVVVLYPTSAENPSRVHVFKRGHNARVISVDVNWGWNTNNKRAVTAAEDNVVKLWDVEKLVASSTHEAHKADMKDTLVGARFLTEDRVLSVTEGGSMYFWHPSTGETNKLSNFLGPKVVVTCFEPCPHATYITAFGLKNGLVITANLKKNGTVLHRLRGHTMEVLSLSWCPAPFNVFPSNPNNYIKGTLPPENEDEKPKDMPENKAEKPKDMPENKDEKPKDMPEDKVEKPEDTPEDKAEKPKDTPEDKAEKPNDMPENKAEKPQDTEVEDNTVKQNGVSEHPANGEEKVADKTSENLSETKEAEEVQCTKTVVAQEEEPRTDYLLASSGIDAMVYIWRGGSDGRMQCFFKVGNQNERGFKKGSRKSNWIVLNWISPFKLLTNFFRGDMRYYTLPKPKGNKKSFTTIHNDHQLCPFSICAPKTILTADDWLIPSDMKFWTFGQDMYLLNTVYNSSATQLTAMETFYALINCMAQSPLDPTRIALGLSNGCVKIWNANNFQVKKFSLTTFTVDNSNITALAWHPTNELLLAFSTYEGKVGLLTINGSKKRATFKQYFTNVIHKIEWGPIKGGNFGLYALSSGKLAIFDPEKPQEEPTEVKLNNDSQPYTFAWKLDMSSLLVSYCHGKNSFLSSCLTEANVSYHNQKKISLAVWHPHSQLDESTAYSFWLAAAVDNVVYVLDFCKLSEQSGTLKTEDVTVAVFDKHVDAVKCMAWSPFENDWLVSAGEDGIAHVWNVTSKELMSSYHGWNFEPIKAVMWNPVQAHSLYCNTTAVSFVIWDMRNHAPANEDVLAKQKIAIRNDKKTSHAKEEETVSKTLQKAKKNIKCPILPVISTGDKDRFKENLIRLKHLFAWKQGDGINGVTTLKLFGTKEEVLELLTINELSLCEKAKHEPQATVALWKGDLESTIQEAIDKRTVTPSLISMAPMVSLSAWQKCCQTYADQLEEKPSSDPIEMATFYLLCQDVTKAIQSLCDREMFKEALVLAKIRLPPDNIFVNQILEKWAGFAAYCGSLETAAECYLVLEKYEEAVKVLLRRNDYDILKFALMVAEKTGNEELIKTAQFRCDSVDQETVEEIPLPDRKDLILEKVLNGHVETEDSKAREVSDENQPEDIDIEKFNFL